MVSLFFNSILVVQDISYCQSALEAINSAFASLSVILYNIAYEMVIIF